MTKHLFRLALISFLALGLAPLSSAEPAEERDRSAPSTRWTGEEDDEDDGGWSDDDGGDWDDDDGGDWDDDGGGSDRGGQSAPEIDPGLFVAGIVLLAGGTAILVGRRRQRRAAELS